MTKLTTLAGVGLFVVVCCTGVSLAQSPNIAAQNLRAAERQSTTIIRLSSAPLEIEAGRSDVSVNGSKTRLSYTKATSFLEQYVKATRPQVIFFRDTDKAENTAANSLLKRLEELSSEHKFALIVFPPPVGYHPPEELSIDEILAHFVETGELVLGKQSGR